MKRPSAAASKIGGRQEKRRKYDLSFLRGKPIMEVRSDKDNIFIAFIMGLAARMLRVDAIA